MPRPSVKATEMPQRQSTRGPPRLRTSSTDSDPLRPRLTTPRSPKLGDRRSPRSVQSDPVTKKKFGTRISDLESRLGEAQQELKSLKEQLVSAEAAKQKAQDELERKSKKPMTQDSDELQVKHFTEENQRATDVFEVPMEIVSVELKQDAKITDQVTKESKSCSDLESQKDEISFLETKLKDKESEFLLLSQQNEDLKKDLTEASSKISATQIKEDETNIKLTQLHEELEESKAAAVNMNNKLQNAEQANEKLESEMKLLRVQTEQWRKAADAAAAVLAGEVDMKGRRISERCGSMDKQHIGNGSFEALDGGGSSPLIGDGFDDGFGSKRKGGGIKMFGDLWKKKGQK